MTPPIVVHPPSQSGGRRVTAHTESLGTAHRPEDVVEFLRRAGLEPSEIQLDDPNLIEWRGGGPDVWE
ncbi:MULTISPECIES: hypothetical protein [Streptomyces]|uniref:Uncharacterized protein n=1 Tax=Streptomyces cacaoi TaxID=1898 RepID=A0A4Y3QXS7_STRCI|nr:MULTISPECIES: hypothetical protein [Streptomyces]NNG85479.1 hypothetical protein [Streptomyces cacaoi]QHF93712.1 hypothetical protein DEH18_07320 [Streptomyces sp. NHF165]GEB50204.1 hypothetical protein SCA03_27550 [Streptomyces cacaoi]